MFLLETTKFISSMASLNTPPQSTSKIQQIYIKSLNQQYDSQFAVPRKASIPAYGLQNSKLGVVRFSNQPQLLTHSRLKSDSEVPLLSCEEAIERLRLSRVRNKGKQEFLAMYSSVFGGITTDPTVMVIPMDDHMVHRGHGVFDTTAITDGHLYELDQHLDRFLRSASMAKISLQIDRESMRSILIQTASASKCRTGSLRYWLSAGPGDFRLSPSGCAQSAFYAIVIQTLSPSNYKGIKVITTSIPIKPPVFATMKSVNYLPNVLCQMEAEENGCFASIWLDLDGFVAEGPNMNVVFVTVEKEVLMPRFDKILGGCTAKRVIVLLEEMVKKGDIRGVSVRDVSVEEGKKAAEMMLLGSGVLVRPVI